MPGIVSRELKTGSSFFVTALLWAAFLGWMGVLWKLSSLPGNDLPGMEIPFADKVAHFGYFLLGGVLLASALHRSLPWTGWKMAVPVLMVMAAIGALDEWHQVYTPNRSGSDRGDWMADCAGGMAGAIMIGWIYARAKRRKPGEPGSLAPPGD